MKSLRCKLGSHNFEKVDAIILKTEEWCETYRGQKLQGSDYKVHFYLQIDKCSRCGQEKAYETGMNGWTYPHNLESARERIKAHRKK